MKISKNRAWRSTFTFSSANFQRVKSLSVSEARLVFRGAPKFLRVPSCPAITFSSSAIFALDKFLEEKGIRNYQTGINFGLMIRN